MFRQKFAERVADILAVKKGRDEGSRE